MTQNTNPKPTLFDDLVHHGFGAMTKADLEGLIFHHLVQGGLVSSSATDADLAERFRLPLRRMQAIRRMADARFGTPDSRHRQLREWLVHNLNEDNMTQWRKHARAVSGDGAMIPIIVRNVVVRDCMIAELSKRNRFVSTTIGGEAVVLQPYDLLVLLSGDRVTTEWESEVAAALRRLCDEMKVKPDLSELFVMDVGSWSSDSFRHAINIALARAAAGAVPGAVTSILGAIWSVFFGGLGPGGR